MENYVDKVFYHLYPLGFCGAPRFNDFACPAGKGLSSLAGHIDRLRYLGVNALLIGPLFESCSHGYDTVDYYHVDRRLGNNEDLRRLVRAFHDAGMRVILDGVFNHTGREFFAFKGIKAQGAASAYTDWYVGLDFSRNNDQGDGFSYEGWAGHTSLVKLNGNSPAVREYLFGAVRFWIDEFDIDGLRLDAANVLSDSFLRELSVRCRAWKPHFWLMGEMVSGDYRSLAREGCLDSVTNYELYKGLWSSFNDRNFFEIAWTLNRQFSPGGLYPHLGLYNFADNHDVHRVASSLKQPAHLFPLYGLLFCVPGIPSIYYGSEYGIRGGRSPWSDLALRPPWDGAWERRKEGQDLFRAIRDFARIRRESEALRYGGYRELLVAPEQFAFLRESGRERVITAVNASEKGATVFIPRQQMPGPPSVWRDLLSGEVFPGREEGMSIPLYPSWLRILREERDGPITPPS